MSIISRAPANRFQTVGGDLYSGTISVSTAVCFADAVRAARSVTGRILWGIVCPTDGSVLLGDSASQSFPLSQSTISPDIASANGAEQLYLKASSGTVVCAYFVAMAED